MSRAARRFQEQWEEFYGRVSQDPLVFAKEALLCDGVHNHALTEQQINVLKVIGDETTLPYDERKKRVTVKSGQGVGKSRLETIFALYRAFYAVDALVIVTAPTLNQIKDVWFAEMRRLLANAHPLVKQMCEPTSMRVRIGGRKDWGILGKAASKPENFQGFHQDYLTIIVDEASGVERPIFNTIKGTLTNPDSLLVLCGNPNCVVGSSMVFDEGSGYVTVEELANRPGGKCRVPTMVEETHKLGIRPAKAFYSGEKECVRVETWAGQSLELSTDHPVYTQRGWVHAGDINPGGDWVATPRKMPGPESPLEFSDEDIKLLAYAITDSNTRRHFDFTQLPGPVLDEFCEIVEALGGRYRVRQVPENKAKVVNVSGMSSWLRSWGLWDCVAHTKRVPAEVFLLPDEQVALFLNRFWACDGSFFGQGPKLTMCNRELVQDIQTLLRRFGILARIRPQTAKPSGNTFEYLKGREFQSWNLAVQGKENVALWKEHIGEVLGKEGKCPDPKEKGRTNCDVVPLAFEDFVDPIATRAFGKGGKGNKSADPRRAPFVNKYRRLRHLSVSKVAEMMDEAGETVPEWTRWSDSDLHWVEVEKVTPTGKQKVYDLEVPGRGNFVCDGVVVHNSRETYFFDSFYSPVERSHWHKFTFDARESPITDKENIRRLAMEFGENSDEYRVRVLGEFPLQEANAVMSDIDVLACTAPGMMLPRAKARGVQQEDNVLAIDFARFGSDESVIYRRSGMAIVEARRFARTEPLDVADAAFEMQRRAGWSNQDCMYVVDAGGMGQGVLGAFYRANKRVHEFQSQHKSSQPNYADKITEAYFHVGRLTKERAIYLPEDPVLVGQLAGRLYEHDAKSRLKIEKKDAYKKRHDGQSPDRADACVMAFYNAVKIRAEVT